MKATRGTIGRALARPDPQLRFFLFHGPDEAQSRALAATLLGNLGAEKFALSSAAVKSDPALLADEAAAMGLFGEKRAIWIEPAGEEIAAGVEALLEAPAAENPVIAIAGQLRKGSALLKAAESHPQALAFVSYALEGEDAERLVVELGRAEGLRISPDVAARIAEAAGNDRGVIHQELSKLSLYVGASPDHPRELGHDALDAVGADLAEGDLMRIADIALSGELSELVAELERLPARGGEAIPVLRSLQRRLMMLAPIRARIESGERPDAVMASVDKSLFWKDKPLVHKLLRSWDAARLATALERSGALERQLMRSDSPPETAALGQELVAIARTVRSRR